MSKRPPEPPPTKPRLEFYALQAIGMGIFALVAVLALFGVFGESVEKASARAGEIAIDVRYPTRLRYKTVSSIDVELRNDGQQATPVEVRFPSSYLSKFSNLKFSPEPKVSSMSEHVVELEPIAPGHSRLVSVELQSEKYGSFSGQIVVKAGESPGSVEVHTINLP